MKSAKIIAVLLLLAVLAANLCGCHGYRTLQPFVLPDAFDESRQYEITFWAKNDTNVAQTRIYESAIKDFEALYPNITVSLRLYTDYGRIYNDVITNIATHTTPDVCVTYPDHIATYLTGVNTVVPLDGLFADEKYGLGGSEVKFDSVSYEELVEKFIGECEFGGSHYAIPFMRSTEACYVNKTYVEALGYTLPETLTWDFIWEVSDAAAKKDENGVFALNGQNVMLPFIYKSTDNMTITVLRQLGADYSDSDGNIGLFNDTTKEFLRQIALHTERGAFSTFKISGYPANFLNAGQCVFAIDSTAGSTWMGSDAPLLDISPDRLVKFETAVMTVPQYDTASPAMISQGPSVAVFNHDDPQRVLAAWLFAQYLLTDGVQIPYAETEGYVPVTSRSQQSDEYKDYLSRGGEDGKEHYSVKIQATRLLLDNISNTFVTPVFNGSASLRDAAGQIVERVTKSVRRDETVDDGYYESLFADITALYRLDRADSENDGNEIDSPLPMEAKALLFSIASAWLLIAAYVIYRRMKSRKN